MKTNSKLSAYILRGSTGALLVSCVVVALCSAIHLPEQQRKALPPQDNAGSGANRHQNRSLSFADRVAYQREIEDVYWQHRIWQRERPDPKPSLDAVMCQAQLEKKVAEYLRNSQALEDSWQWPLTADELQAEMKRMASHTKQPRMLREIFAALGNGFARKRSRQASFRHNEQNNKMDFRNQNSHPILLTLLILSGSNKR